MQRTAKTKSDGMSVNVRRERNVGTIFRSVLLISIPVIALAFIGRLDIQVFGIALWRQQVMLAVLSLGLAGIFVGGARIRWYDWTLAFASLATGVYSVWLYPLFLSREPTLVQMVAAAITLVLVLEASRRLLGWFFFGFILLFILYARFADHAPGFLEGFGLQWHRLVAYLHSDTSALVGVPLQVAVLTVLPFVLFGAGLAKMGGGPFFIDLAMSLAGRFRGGPAKVSVLASSLLGTVTGSAVANVASSGVITIPIMKKCGLKPEAAAAIESVSSTGGQIMPPIMGAAAFLMAEFLGIPYSQIVLAALIPACLYFLTVFIQVHLDAVKHDIGGIDEEDIPRLGPVLRQGWHFLLPLVALVAMLFLSPLSIEQVGIASAALLFVISSIRSPKRWYVDLAEVLIETGRTALPIIIATAAAGLIVGVISVTGLGFAFTTAILQLGQESLLTTLLLAALIALILGVGMPTAAAYVLVATMVAPALTTLGITAIAAHLFLLYFAMLSMITPPVNVAVLTAAPMAEANYWKASFKAVQLGIAAYILPFAFVAHPALLMLGDPVSIVIATLEVLFGVLAISVGLTGFFLRPQSLLKRALFIGIGLALILPTTNTVYMVAGILALIIFVFERFALNKPQAQAGLQER